MLLRSLEESSIEKLIYMNDEKITQLVLPKCHLKFVLEGLHNDIIP